MKTFQFVFQSIQPGTFPGSTGLVAIFEIIGSNDLAVRIDQDAYSCQAITKVSSLDEASNLGASSVNKTGVAV